MGKAKEIAEGLANYLLRRQNEISEMRMIICNACDYISTKHETSRPDVHCMKCNCTLATKTRSLDSECPIGEWSKIPTNHEKQKNKKVHNKESSIE